MQSPREEMTSYPTSIWLDQLRKESDRNVKDQPNWYARKPEVLCTESRLHNFMVGSGADIFSSLQQSIEAAESEIVFVTCFWAKSQSLDRLIACLKRISDKVIKNKSSKIRVYIGLSSLSVFQKLFQTSSLAGRSYNPKKWTRQLGLPPASDLPGLEITIKSIFVRPFSVMHPKFIIIDRKCVWLPSCNVSWETWLEGAIVLSGTLVQNFVCFWQQVWQGLSDHQLDTTIPLPLASEDHCVEYLGGLKRSSTFVPKALTTEEAVETLFLPSPHHFNPQFRLLPWQKHPQEPPTPLNTFLLATIRIAKNSIYLQSPNFTATAMINALLDAVQRGVNIHIVTSEKMMILEQLVTAGTTTSRCIRKMVRAYEKIQNSARLSDVEMGVSKPGALRIDHYMPRTEKASDEPVKSHIKFTIVDDEWVALGSGNMDRASFYTSQELGVALHSNSIVQNLKDTLETGLEGRKKLFYQSNTT